MNAWIEADQVQPCWTLTPHACRHCLGRVLAGQGDSVNEVRCAECGAHATGGYRELCCCGTAYGVGSQILECYVNPAVSKAVPQQVLVREWVGKPP